MATTPPEAPTEENKSRTDAQVWRDMRNRFRENRQAIMQVRDRDGLEAAKLKQAYMLKDMEDREPWIRMFAEGAMRNLHSATIVREAYDSLCDLAMPIPSVEENRLIELTQIRQFLFQTLQQTHEKIRAGVKNYIDPTLRDELDHASERLETYADLVETYPEAAQLIEESKVIIVDFRAMIRRNSKK